MKRKNLICIGSDGGGAIRDEEGTFARFSTGVLVNLLALDYEKVVWCAPRSQEGREQRAIKLADNVKFVESPEFCANLPQTLIRRERFRDSWRNALSEPGDVFMFGRFPIRTGPREKGRRPDPVIASQCAHWRGNPFPFHVVIQPAPENAPTPRSRHCETSAYTGRGNPFPLSFVIQTIWDISPPKWDSSN